jgi:hypothetical protein
MTIFYVRKSGNNANNGMSPAQAWLTIGKALGPTPNGAGTNPSPGDTIYIGSGVYREQVIAGGTAGTAGNPLSIIGDIDGTKTGDPPGMPRWTGFDVSDTAVPTGASATLNVTNKNYWTFRQIYFHGGKTNVIITTAVTIGLTFQDCLFVSGSASGNTFNFAMAVDGPTNLLIDRCRSIQLWSNATHAVFNLPTSTVADYNAASTIQNCLFLGGYVHIQPQGTGANAFKGGGIAITNCSLLCGSSRSVFAGNANISTTIPCTVNNCIINAGIGLNANTLGQIVESYNDIYSSTPYTNVTAGTGSISNSSYASLFNADQDFMIGRPNPRHFFAPSPDSPLLNFGLLASPPSVDLLNRQKPSGPGLTWSGSNGAVGCLESHDFGVQNTVTVPGTASNSLLLAGPGDHEILVPVAPIVTTLSIQVYRDSNYGGGANPALAMLAAPEIAVLAQSVSDTGAATTFNTITLAPFVPTGNGVVRLRLLSNAAGNGNVYWGMLNAA